MLLSFVPPPLVFSAISPIVNPKTLFFVIFILSVVSDSVLIEVDAEPMHVVHFPLPVVLASIMPKIDPVSVNFVVKPLSFECRSVRPFIDSKALFLAHDVAALISGPLWPRFDALAVLLVVFPVAWVLGATNIRVGSPSIALVVEPTAFIDITIGMEECPDPAGVIELPLADILGVVRPLHSALAMTKAAFPLTLIDSPSLIGVNSENKFISIFEFSF